MQFDTKLLGCKVTTTPQATPPNKPATIVGIDVTSNSRVEFLLAFDDGSMEFYDYRFVRLTKETKDG